MNRASTIVVAIALFPFLAAPAEYSPRGCEEAHETAAIDRRVGSEGIVNGTPTNYDSWQGAIALISTEHGLVCTGTLIDPQVVLSAGHCVLLPDYGIDFVTSPGQLWIGGGADAMNAPIYIEAAQSVVVHPTWDGYEWGTDLSLIRLASPVTDIPSYALRKPPQAQVKEPAKIVGYGMLGYDEYDSSGIHRMGDTTILTITNDEIELGGETNCCYGDSGGPAFTFQNGEWVISGVASHIVEETCWADHGGWYVNVVTYLDWIDEVVTEMIGADAGTDADADADTDADSDADPDTDTGDTDEDVLEVMPIEHACTCAAPGAVDSTTAGLSRSVASSIPWPG